MNPASLTTLTAAIRTFGATPTMPTPLRAAAMVPATWVPWSLVVGNHPVGERSGRPASVQFTELALSDVGGEVRVVRVDAAVEHVAGAVGDLVGLVGLDHLHVPLLGLARVDRDGRFSLAAEVAVDGLLRALLVVGRARPPRRGETVR